jgi:hypothetical protein
MDGPAFGAFSPGARFFCAMAVPPALLVARLAVMTPTPFRLFRKS